MAEPSTTHDNIAAGGRPMRPVTFKRDRANASMHMCCIYSPIHFFEQATTAKRGVRHHGRWGCCLLPPLLLYDRLYGIVCSWVQEIFKPRRRVKSCTGVDLDLCICWMLGLEGVGIVCCFSHGAGFCPLPVLSTQIFASTCLL